MIQTAFRQHLVVGGLLLVLTVLLIGSTIPDPVRHQRTLAALQTLVLHDAALQRDLLRTRTGVLNHYDPLVRSVEKLRTAVVELGGAGDVVGPRNAAEFDHQLGDLTAAVEVREALVEDFKSYNALFQNSLTYFIRTSYEIGRLAADNWGAAGIETAALTIAMFRFIDDPGSLLVAEVTAALERVERLSTSAPLRSEAHAMVIHGRLILGLLPRVDAALGRLLDNSISDRVHQFRAWYFEHHGQAVTQAQGFRVLLYLAALLLLIYLGFVLVRLRAQTRALRARFGFERLTAKISAQFINLPGERVDEGICSNLRHLIEGLDLDRAVIRLGDGKTYVASRDLLGNDGAVKDGRSDHQDSPTWQIAGHNDYDGSDHGGCIQVPSVAVLPPGPEKAALAARGVRSWLCVPMRAAGQRIGYLELEMVRYEKSWPDDDIALLQLAGEIFANAIERVRGEAEKEALARRLRQAQRIEALGTLAGGIAHNFNNILGAIMGYAEMAHDDLPKGSPARRHVREVLLAGERAREIVEQIYAFGRRGDPGYQLVNLPPLIKETTRLLRATLPSTTRICTTVESGDLTVRADAAQIQQVVVNLCTNATQAMGWQGTVEIGLDRTVLTEERVLSHGTLPAGDYVRIRVRDTGHGMDQLTLQRIFEPFFTTKSAGIGLGLPSVHGIVADHQGALNVVSQPGMGSVFETYLPHVEATEAIADLDLPCTRSLTRGRGETILFVDDETVLVRLGEEVLAALGFEPVGFHDSLSALAAFQADPDRFDLVLTDEVMPGMTGSQLASALHRIRPDLPIVLMTAHRMPPGSHRLSAIGVREVLHKPLLARNILESIGRWLPR